MIVNSVKQNIFYIIFLIVFLIVFQLVSLHSFAQENEEKYPVSTSMIKFNGGAAFPGGDLKDRFGRAGFAGGGFYYKTASNWIIGGEFDYYFGNEVKDSVFGDFLTPQGYFIGVDGLLYQPILYQRGYKLQVGGGKILPLLDPNPNSGVTVMAHIGFLQHKISIFTPEQANLPQLNDDMKKGFDRLTNGLALSQFIGYFFMSENRLVNFSIGLEITEAFTQNRRTVNFYDNTDPSASRLDMLYAIKASWILPLYKRDQTNVYYY